MSISDIPIYSTLLFTILIAYSCYFLYFLNDKRLIIYENKVMITKSYDEFVHLYNDDRYFSKRDYQRWLIQNTDMGAPLKKCEEYILGLKKLNDITQILKPILGRIVNYFKLDEDFQGKIEYLLKIMYEGLEIVHERNELYIKKELDVYKEFFDRVESNPLTIEQRQSIIVDEAHNLVVAGAGTGKTSTIVGKAGYLLRKRLTEEEDILLLSFAWIPNREMRDRSRARLSTELNIRTFHGLGLSILRRSQAYRPIVSKLSEDSLFLQKKIEEFIQNKLVNVDFANKINEYFVFYLRPVENELDIKTEQEYEAYIRSVEIRTLNGEKVKSYAECEIANFLLINGVEYRYEYPYTVDTSTEERQQYRPDFYLPGYDIWIEHIGIDRNGNTAKGIDRSKYLGDLQWKRDVHRKNGTTLMETYSYEHFEGTLLSNLNGKLAQHGVQYKEIPQQDIFLKLRRLGEVNQFTRLLVKFLRLYKSNTLTMQDLEKKAMTYPFPKRYTSFLSIFKEIHAEYEKHLRENNEIDFDDMIKLATEQVEHGNYRRRFKYILVDEFQDISQSRYRLLKALLNQKEDTKLFAVGDDWQSIYRFTGSDLSIMTSFQKYFKPSEIMYLTQTFRFNERIRDASSSFIMKNPQQYKKSLTAIKDELGGVTIVWYDNLDQALRETVYKINPLENRAAEVQIMGRYNSGFYRDLKESAFLVRGHGHQQRLDEDPLRVSTKYLTVHKSKGSEAEYGIIIGVKEGKYGFPCEIEDDPILNLVLSEDDEYPNAEERRIFYVALTRGKKQTYILADRNQVSKFMKELVEDNPSIQVMGRPPILIQCPECKKGFITRKEAPGKAQYRCSRHPICKFEPITCPQCGSGFLVQSAEKVNYYVCSNDECSSNVRKCPWCDGYLQIREKNGRFWGCSNYWSKKCRYTEPIVDG